MNVLVTPASIGAAHTEGTLPRPRLSTIMNDLAQGMHAPRIGLGEVLEAIEDRAFGALLLVFAVPNLLPTPPGAGILGLPLLLLSLQLATGRMPWLPRAIRDRSLERQRFVDLARRAVPILERGERLLRPRLSALFHPLAERGLGWFCLLLSVVLFLPIPFGNMLPALAITVIALGLLERDGLWIIVGAAMGCAALTLLTGVLILAASALGRVVAG